MIRSKSPFPPRCRPQTHDSPSLPAAFLHPLELLFRLVDASLRHYFLTSFGPTQDCPQPQSPQSLAHNSLDRGGVPLRSTIFEFPFSSFGLAAISVSPLFATLTKSKQPHENKTALSPAFATLTRCGKHNSFVCHSYRKHSGVGYPRPANLRSSTLLFSGNFSTNPPYSTQGPVGGLILPRPAVPRGAA